MSSLSAQSKTIIEENVEAISQKEPFNIFGLNLPIFLGIFAVIVIGMYLNVVPVNMLTGFVLTMALGGLLMKLGDITPGIKVIGGGSILCFVVPALMTYLGVFPENGTEIIKVFLSEFGFSEFVVSGLVAGSLLSMDRTVLLKVGARIFLPIMGGVVLTMGVGALIGYMTGFGVAESIFFVVAPIMGGGIAAGAIPMSEIFEANNGGSASYFLAMSIPAVIIGNILCIVIASLLNRMGKKDRNMFKGFSGEGEILRVKEQNATPKHVEKFETLEPSVSQVLTSLAGGLVISGGLYVFGSILNSFFPSLHTYVFVILSAVVLKVIGLIPASLEQATGYWSDLISKAWVPSMLVSISVSMINFNDVISAMGSPVYLVITTLTVILATLGAGFIGWLLHLYFVESAISAGLGMADMGGSGDVAVISASERLGLLPFLQISSRIGGAIILVMVSFLAPLIL